MSKGGSVGSQSTTQQARGSFSGNSQPSYGGNQAGGLGSKGGSQSYQQPYRSPYGQGPSYSQHGMRSGFDGLRTNYQNPNLQQAIPTQTTNPNLPKIYSNGSSGTFQQFGDFSVGVEGPPITYGTATPNFDILGQVAGDNNNAEASMRIGQVAPHPHFKQERNLQDIQYGQVAPQQFSGGFGSKGGLMNQTGRGYRSGIGGFF